MKKQKHMSKAELIALGIGHQQAFDSVTGSIKLIALTVLHERNDFDAAMLNQFVDDFEDVLAYYNESKDYKAQLIEWNDYFMEYAGIKILPGEGRK